MALGVTSQLRRPRSRPERPSQATRPGLEAETRSFHLQRIRETGAGCSRDGTRRGEDVDAPSTVNNPWSWRDLVDDGSWCSGARTWKVTVGRTGRPSRRSRARAERVAIRDGPPAASRDSCHGFGQLYAASRAVSAPRPSGSLLVQPLFVVFMVPSATAATLEQRHLLLYMLGIPVLTPAILTAYAVAGARAAGQSRVGPTTPAAAQTTIAAPRRRRWDIPVPQVYNPLP